MSEQWWALEDKTAGPFAAFKHLEAASDEADFHRHEHGMEIEIVPVRIVKDAEPCDTEKGMVDPVSYFKEMGYSYCPYCGRDLEES